MRVSVLSQGANREMNNLTALRRPEEIKAYVLDLWRTDLFKKSQLETGGYIAEVVSTLAKRPAVFFKMEDPDIEWSQFTTWMGAYALRPDYDNDAIHDLYYLHEFLHGATMTYDGSISFPDWYRKMCENEMFASTHSEAYVYFRMRDLREETFDFDIWADRYLTPDPNTSFFPTGESLFTVFCENEKEKEKALFRGLYTERKKAMKNPDPFDFLEMQIHYYSEQNMQWCNIWQNSFREVEQHMESYLKSAEEEGWEKALEDHIDWLEEKKGGNFTPYQEEAVVFAKLVKDNKSRQGNNLLTK